MCLVCVWDGFALNLKLIWGVLGMCFGCVCGGCNLFGMCFWDVFVVCVWGVLGVYFCNVCLGNVWVAFGICFWDVLVCAWFVFGMCSGGI